MDDLEQAPPSVLNFQINFDPPAGRAPASLARAEFDPALVTPGDWYGAALTGQFLFETQIPAETPDVVLVTDEAETGATGSSIGALSDA